MLSAGETTVYHRYRLTPTGADGATVKGEVLVTGPYRRPDLVP
jgi:hypothetical protein